MFRWLNVVLLLAVLLLADCQRAAAAPQPQFSYFSGLADFSVFSTTVTTNGQAVLLSPWINSHMPWTELIVSWNATAPAGAWLQVEARAQLPDHPTKFYTLGRWSPDNATFPRTSVRGQRDADGRVATDTLVMKNPAQAVQLRVTLGGTNGAQPALKFLGLSFCNALLPPTEIPPNHAAWGKIIPTPERSQHSYPQQKGWCSPTSVSMDLARWSEVLNRPELNLEVPDVAAKVYDESFGGTGNWPFNTAFAGGFDGMRAYVSRFDDLTEVEDWIAAGIPVILSARWDMLKPGRPFDDAGHLVVCIGFTPAGDVVINDPATNLKKESVRHIYRRADVSRAWATSHNTVYLIYPAGAKVPKNLYQHW